MKLILALLTTIILLLAFIGVDYATGHTETIECLVIEKAYEPPSTSVGVGTGVTSGGNVGTGTVVMSKSEGYRLIIKIGEDVTSKSVSAVEYARANPDRTINLRFRFGGITGNRY